MKNILKTSLIASSILLFTGCRSQIKELDKTDYQEPKVKNTKLFNEDLKLRYKNANTIQNSKEYIKYNIELEQSDLSELKDKRLQVSINNMTFKEVMEELSLITDSGLFYSYNDNDNSVVSSTQQIVNTVAEKTLNNPIVTNSEDKFSFNVNTNIYNIITSLERYRNKDIQYKNNTFYVFDKITIQGSLSAENKQTKTFDNLKTHITSLLGGEAKVLVDGLTGTFSVTHTPNEMRDNIDIIENIINVSNSSRLFKMYVYKINNNLLKENGLNRSMFIGDVMTLASGGSISQTPIFDRLFKKEKIGQVFNKDVGINLGLQLREQEEIIHSVSTLSLNVFNGVDSTMKSTKEGGNWTPGELTSQNSVVNGVSQTTYTEEKPTFESEEVGLQLTISPSVNSRQKNMVLNIKYNESSIFGTDSQVWNRSEDSSITLNKNLKSQSDINTMISLNGDGYKVISGLKEESFNGSSDFNPLLNYLGNQGKTVEKKDMLVIAKREFPSKTITKTITKKNLIKFKNDKKVFKYVKPKNEVKPKIKIVEKIVYKDRIIEKPVEVKSKEELTRKEVLDRVIEIKKELIERKKEFKNKQTITEEDKLKEQKQVEELSKKLQELKLNFKKSLF